MPNAIEFQVGFSILTRASLQQQARIVTPLTARVSPSLARFEDRDSTRGPWRTRTAREGDPWAHKPEWDGCEVERGRKFTFAWAARMIRKISPFPVVLFFDRR